MNLELMIIDNFYTNPDSVRNYALSQPFDVTGNYPGARTKPYLPDDVKLLFHKGVALWRCIENYEIGIIEREAFIREMRKIDAC